MTTHCPCSRRLAHAESEAAALRARLAALEARLALLESRTLTGPPAVTADDLLDLHRRRQTLPFAVTHKGREGG